MWLAQPLSLFAAKRSHILACESGRSATRDLEEVRKMASVYLNCSGVRCNLEWDS